MSRERIAQNPFYVLELDRSATSMEVERAGQKWLAMLEVELVEARTYPSPLGGMPRDADLVRRAVDELRDPDRRLQHEVWATLDPSIEATLDREMDDAEPRLAGWPDALAHLGWGRRR